MPDIINEQNQLASIRKMVGSIARSAAKLNETIHTCAVLCMQHARDYGDCQNTAAKLIDALPNSHRRSLVINWFAAFSPVSIAKDGKTGQMKAHLSGKQEDRVWNVDAARATPFYAMPEAAVEPDVPTFASIHENVVAFIKRMEGKADKIANDDDKAKALAELAKVKAAVAA